MLITKDGFHVWECACGQLYRFYWRESGTAIYAYKASAGKHVRVGWHPSHNMTTWSCSCRRLWQPETPGRGAYAR